MGRLDKQDSIEMKAPGDQLSRILTEVCSIVRANFIPSPSDQLIEQSSLVTSRGLAPQPWQRHAGMGFLTSVNKPTFNRQHCESVGRGF